MTTIQPDAGPRSQRSSAALARSDLSQIVRSVAADEDLWRPRVRHELHRRHYERLAYAPDHEVWLICWDLAQTTLLHDHGGGSGAFTVVAGSLLEDFGRRGCRRLGQRRVKRGGLRTFSPDYVHDLVNAGPGLATSIHAYSPPLTAMSYYVILPDGAILVRTVAVDTPEPEPHDR
jgi:hypothetical protein